MKTSLEGLSGGYRDRTLLVVSCGPSAVHWRRVRSLLPEGTVIACIKQAIFLCRRDAEIHFFNAFNCQRYFPLNRKALRVSVVDEQSPVDFNGRDLTFSLAPETCTSLEASVAASGRFEDFTIENSGLVKPWGPGIMYEIVAYLALHLGFREVHTVGWDVVLESGDPAGQPATLAHFYDSRKSASQGPRQDYAWLVANPARYRSKAFVRHLLGLRYNQMPKADKGREIPTILRSLPRFLEWLASHRLFLTMHTVLGNRDVRDEVVRDHVHDLTSLLSARQT